MKKAHRCGVGLILLVYLALGLTYGLVVPPFENLDEIEHFGVVRYIADTGGLPVHGTPAAEVYHYRQEASQPPLYYLLSAGLVRLLGSRADDAADFWRFNPWVACGPGSANLYDNRAIFYHNPNREAFPWQDTLLMLHVLRAWSTLLQTVTVAGTYVLARLAFPRRWEVAWLSAAVVAFNPQFLLVASGVNNDNLVTPLVTLGLCLLLRTWREGLAAKRALALGLLTGLAGLSKLSGWLLLPLSCLLILILALPSQTRRRSLFVVHCSLFILTAAAVSGWWFWRNWRLYGDPTALPPMLKLVGVRGAPINPLFGAGLMFRSFWGQIPCSFYPSAFYAFYGALTALALGGLMWGWRRFTVQERRVTILLAGWFLLVVAGWVRWDMVTPAPGGRLLFPALPAVALLMALGIGHCSLLIRHTPFFRHLPLAIGHWSLVVGLLALLAWWTGAHILPGFFAPPPRYADADAVRPDHRLDATWGDTIGLLGYDVALQERGPTLDVTLYWQALAPMSEDYTLALQLVSPVPGDTTLRWNYNAWPGRGNYPTSAWQPDEVIADHYRFRLPEADFPIQAWDLHLVLYREETGERLPVRVDEVAVGDRLVLARLRVPGLPPLCPEEGRLTSQVRFGDAAVLTHALVTPEREVTRVVLCWKAIQPLPADYTVFVHLTDSNGELIATGDGAPMEGAFPTSMWQPGDIILDVHCLLVAPDDAGQRIAVGLYNLGDGSRLPVYIEKVISLDAAVSVWPDRP